MTGDRAESTAEEQRYEYRIRVRSYDRDGETRYSAILDQTSQGGLRQLGTSREEVVDGLSNWLQALAEREVPRLGQDTGKMDPVPQRSEFIHLEDETDLGITPTELCEQQASLRDFIKGATA